MNNLSIDTGLQEYNLNDKCTVHFNPSDASFLQRLYEAFDKMTEKQGEYTETIEKLKDAKDIFAFMQKIDVEMRELIDGIFDVPVCEPLFSNTHIFARATNGVPVWANLIMIIIDECDDATRDVDNRANARVEKYLAKWQKR